MIALPSATPDGSRSRIVLSIATVTVPRSMVDAVVTEYGVARLDGRSVAERQQALIAIAHPERRAALAIRGGSNVMTVHHPPPAKTSTNSSSTTSTCNSNGAALRPRPTTSCSPRTQRACTWTRRSPKLKNRPHRGNHGRQPGLLRNPLSRTGLHR